MIYRLVWAWYIPGIFLDRKKYISPKMVFCTNFPCFLCGTLVCFSMGRTPRSRRLPHKRTEQRRSATLCASIIGACMAENPMHS